MEHDRVHDRQTFAEYVRDLRFELGDPARAADWQNTTLEEFLQGMESWALDWPRPISTNPWRHAAAVLTAAIVYE
jgi:hypothetical protein